MHPTPPVPAVNVADTFCPSHTAARAGDFTLSVGPVGGGFIFQDARVTQSVPVHPDPAEQFDLLPCISIKV